MLSLELKHMQLIVFKVSFLWLAFSFPFSLTNVKLQSDGVVGFILMEEKGDKDIFYSQRMLSCSMNGDWSSFSVSLQPLRAVLYRRTC